MTPFYIDINYQKVEVPQEILFYCDAFTVDATREELRYLDCVYMNMGLYGNSCLLYTSPSPRDRQKSRMPSSA